jgi:predicted nuclease of predicted toxin-antitoxin system
VRLLANENIPLPFVSVLQQQGHEVVSISLRSPGITDEQVLIIAHEDDKILLTFDRDYGMSIYTRHLPSPRADG